MYICMSIYIYISISIYDTYHIYVSSYIIYGRYIYKIYMYVYKLAIFNVHDTMSQKAVQTQLGSVGCDL